MASVGEALGMSLPGSAAVPAVDDRLDGYAERSGETVMRLMDAGITPRDILTRGAFENAISVVMALGGILNMGLFLKVAALFIVALLGLEGGSASVNALMVVLLVTAVAYTAYGGMRSVIATDVLQFVLIIVGLSVALVVVLQVVQWDEAVRAVSQTKGQAGFDPLAAESFGLTYVLWMVLVAGVVSSAISTACSVSRASCWAA